MNKKALICGLIAGLLLSPHALAQEKKPTSLATQTFATLEPGMIMLPTETALPIEGTSLMEVVPPAEQPAPEAQVTEGVDAPVAQLPEAPPEAFPLEETPELTLYVIEWQNSQGHSVLSFQVPEGQTLRQMLGEEAWEAFLKEEWQEAYGAWPEQEGRFSFAFDLPVTQDLVFQEPVPATPPEQPAPQEEPAPREEPAGEAPEYEEAPEAVEETAGETPDPTPATDWSPQITIGCAYEGDAPRLGQRVTLTAQVSNVPVDTDVFLQWQNDSTGEYADVPGATGLQYSFVLTEENAAWGWRVRLVVWDETL